MSIKVEWEGNIIVYRCSESECSFYSYFYRDYMMHVWNEHNKKKKGIQTTFEDDSLNNYALVKFSGGNGE